MIRTIPLARLLLLAATAGVAASCADAPAPTDFDASMLLTAEGKAQAAAGALPELNDQLAAGDAGYELAMAEFYTESGEVGQTVFFNDRGNKQLDFDYLPGDPRRPGADGDPNTIDTWIDMSEGATTSGLSAGRTAAAITSAMDTWDGQRCSGLLGPVVEVNGFDLGIVQFLAGFGGAPFFLNDLTHAGWLPGAFFDVIAGGPNTTLGVTFTFVWIQDLNGDGEQEVAFREIYYNDRYFWTDDGSPGIDVETVALHEAGHGLSQAHFGKLFRTDGNGKFHFAPRAVMNAGYTGPQQSLTGTDLGGHCSNWANWPNG